MKYDFRDRLYEIMERRGHTTRSLEAATGISRRSFSNWKDGKYPGVDVLILLADELRVSTDELLGLNTGKELLQEAIADAKLSGCETCRFGRNFTGSEVVCVNQSSNMCPSRNFACWEWRGYAKTRKDDV